VVRHPNRDRLRARLRQHGIETLIHYPIPVHLQPSFANLGIVAGSLPVTERVAREVLSLPMYVGMLPRHRDRVVEAVRKATTELGGASARA
jgi:aminotransferase EvaB